MNLNQPLEKVKPDQPKADPDAYKPIPGRPGWAANDRGQLQRTVPLPPLPNPWYGLPVIKP